MADPTPAPETCMVMVHEEICVQADVTVRPTVHAGPAMTKCVGGTELQQRSGWDVGQERSGHHHRECRFSVRQLICVTIPIRFGAEVDAEVSDVDCGTPQPGPCMQ